MVLRIGLLGLDSGHAEDFLRHFNRERRYDDMMVTSLWGGSESRTAELLALAPEVIAASSLNDVIVGVDAIVVAARHGDQHLPLALPAINARKPVFIDKPLTCSVSDATALVEAAVAAGTPILSASALRWQPETVALKAQLHELGQPFAIDGYGTWHPDSEYGGAIYYAIHTLELMLELTGTEFRALRLQLGDGPGVVYESGLANVTLSFRRPDANGASAFGISVRSPDLVKDVPITLGDDYMSPVTDRIATMFRSGHGGMDRETLLAPIRLMAEIDSLLAGS